MQFHHLIIKDIQQETADTISISFDFPSPEIAHAFTYIPGQYITLKAQIEGQEVRRAYSICTAPHEDELRVAIKHIPEGVFSTFAQNELKIGDRLEVMVPNGHFYSQYAPQNEKQYVAFAAGSGITPILSIIKHVLKTEPNSTFTLVYGNKTVDTLLFGKALDHIKNRYPDRFNLQYVFSQENRGIPALFGRIDNEKLTLWGKYLFDVKQIDEFFLCGPEEMTQEIRRYLKNQEVKDTHVHFELFHAAAALASDALKTIPLTEKVTANMTVIIDDKEYAFALKTEGIDILQAGIAAGIDLPFSCKGGVCCTCKAKLISGHARMIENYALLEEEVNQGYILTCQAHPTTQNVVISFDD